MLTNIIVVSADFHGEKFTLLEPIFKQKIYPVHYHDAKGCERESYLKIKEKVSSYVIYSL